MSLPIRVRRVLETVSHETGVDVEDLTKAPPGRWVNREWRDLVPARQQAMFEVAQLTSIGTGERFTLHQMGAWFNCDHSTVHYGITRHAERRETEGEEWAA